MSPLLFAALVTQAVPLADLHETTHDQFGRLTIEHERYERRGTPIVHVANTWQKVRLVWLSPDGAVRMRLEDDGAALTMSASVAPGIVGSECLGGNPPIDYAWVSGTSRDWRLIYKALRRVVKGCGLPYETKVARERRSFEAALKDFAPASVALRAAAARVFGSISRRCLVYSPIPTGNPFIGPECRRWSDASRS